MTIIPPFQGQLCFVDKCKIIISLFQFTMPLSLAQHYKTTTLLVFFNVRENSNKLLTLKYEWISLLFES